MVPEIAQRILEYITNPSHGDFNTLALEVFAYQYTNNLPYQRYCNQLRKTPNTVATWEAIPPVSVSAFKETELTCVPSTRYFLTTGTTQGAFHRGKHFLPYPEIYETALRTSFKHYVLPDRSHIAMLMLAPDPIAFPHSSLSYMLADVHKAFGEGETLWMLQQDRIDIDGMLEKIAELGKRGIPVLLCGILSAFMEIISVCVEKKYRFQLASGSRIMDTGGFKGKTLPYSEVELRQYYQDIFHIPHSHHVREFGMTEMYSQFYTTALVSHYENTALQEGYQTPPWVRTRALNPVTMEPCSQGESGLLFHFDLANIPTISALVTEDWGYTVPGGFRYEKRLLGAPKRGCSLSMELYAS
jgi:hypothetical protein